MELGLWEISRLINLPERDQRILNIFLNEYFRSGTYYELTDEDDELAMDLAWSVNCDLMHKLLSAIHDEVELKELSKNA